MKERRLLLHHDTATITVCGMGMARKTKLNDLQQALESKIGGLLNRWTDSRNSYIL
jgi:hypothetical protein